jgi:hypothetical protein
MATPPGGATRGPTSGQAGPGQRDLIRGYARQIAYTARGQGKAPPRGLPALPSGLGPSFSMPPDLAPRMHPGPEGAVGSRSPTSGLKSSFWGICKPGSAFWPDFDPEETKPRPRPTKAPAPAVPLRFAALIRVSLLLLSGIQAEERQLEKPQRAQNRSVTFSTFTAAMHVGIPVYGGLADGTATCAAKGFRKRAGADWRSDAHGIVDLSVHPGFP